MQVRAALSVLTLFVAGCSQEPSTSAPALVDDRPSVDTVSAVAADHDPRSSITFLKPTPNSSVTIIFHTRWNDANGNQTINSKEELLSELEGTKTDFTTDENISVALFFLGLNGAKVRFDLLDSMGKRLLTDRIPIDGDSVFAFREIAAGQLPQSEEYVFHWYLNDESFHSTRVNIISAAEGTSVPAGRSPNAQN
jgi:hypothetical protein